MFDFHTSLCYFDDVGKEHGQGVLPKVVYTAPDCDRCAAGKNEILDHGGQIRLIGCTGVSSRRDAFLFQPVPTGKPAGLFSFDFSI
jgi:hypothetical protein